MTYNFDKVHTVKDLTISIIILGLGAGLYFLNGGLGIALLIAALSAEGESRIENIEQIDRGYEDIEQRLTMLGANICRAE